MANNVGCNTAGSSCQYDHSALMANRRDVRPTDPPVGGADMVLVGSAGAGNLVIWRWVGGNSGWNPHYTYIQADYDTIGSGGPDGEKGDGEGEGAKPPSFPSTGPVYTPLDLAAPKEYSYRTAYPNAAPETGADFQSQGLLTQSILGGAADPYQPWTKNYGDKYFTGYGGENLWNYQPPSVGDKPFYYDLSKGPGPKVGFAK